jgi:hypothetical protein
MPPKKRKKKKKKQNDLPGAGFELPFSAS